ncbi:MAG: hypothetical protein K0U74_07605, partial [Alphaproteobacteria bacterium]|nr:hypothetical protein [Alphaproteobacteria bacterium]
GAQRDMVYRASAATPPRRKSAVSHRDAAKLTAGLRCAGLPWVHHACTGRVLPAVNFVSHRDLTEFFNNLLEVFPR